MITISNKRTTLQSSDLKMLQHRGYTEKLYVNKETGFSVVMLHYPRRRQSIEVDIGNQSIQLISITI